MDSNSNRETAPLLPTAARPAALRSASNPVSNSRREIDSRFTWSLVGGLLGVSLIVGGGFAILHAKSLVKHPSSDTPDFSKGLPPPQPGLRNPSYMETGYNGAVASEVGVCSRIGVEVLKEGGTATDAAIAVTLCIGTTNMFSSGIGGGGFMVIRPSTSLANFNPRCVSPISIDFRETAPSGSFSRMFSPRPSDPSFDPVRASKIGGLSVGVPGELRGLEAAYKLCGGGLPWERLVQPSADLARESKVGLELGRRLGIPYFSGWMLDEPKSSPWRVFFNETTGGLLKAGDTLKRENYARTLETIGREGVDVFYQGSIAELILRTIKDTGGIMTAEDLASYEPIILPAVQANYRNRTYYTGHSPSGGPVLISLLNTLEGYSDYVSGGKTGLAVHRFVESLKFAFAARTELGDPAYIDNDEKLAEITSKSYAAEVRRNISDDQTYTLDHYHPHFDIQEDHGTTHLSVIDKYGSAVSLTSTVNLIFGSRVMDSETGIILNDEMDDFATPDIPDAFGLRPSPFNFPAPGKRSLSSCAPLIMDVNGEVSLVIGGSGGSRIFGSVAQVILNLDWGFDVSNAVEQPRVHDQLSPAYVSIEGGFRPDLIEALALRGHNISLFDINLAIAEIQAIVRLPDGKLFGKLIIVSFDLSRFPVLPTVARLIRDADSTAGLFVASSDSRKNGIPAAY